MPRRVPAGGSSAGGRPSHGAALGPPDRDRHQRRPWEDTPASARAAIERFGLAPFETRWLLGSKAQLEPVWDKYGIEVHRTAGDVEHTDASYLIDSHGWERAGLLYPFLPAWVGDDLKTLAAEARS
jgi:cytochrome oxidase Cu insertion factor (SCO1/SenC/PrrC family)